MNVSLWLAGVMLAAHLGGRSPMPVNAGPPPAPPAKAEPTEAAAAASERSPRIPINTATVDELQKVPGIGPKRAERILEARSKRPFRSPADLRRVKGFGAKTVRRLSEWFIFEVR